MWTYVIAFSKEFPVETAPFMMVRSRKRGGWEMPGGGMEPGEVPILGGIREFIEETGYRLESRDDWMIDYQDGYVIFGFIGRRISDPHDHEISETGLHSDLPEDLAFPEEEYLPLIEMGRKILLQKACGVKSIRAVPGQGKC